MENEKLYLQNLQLQTKLYTLFAHLAANYPEDMKMKNPELIIKKIHKNYKDMVNKGLISKKNKKIKANVIGILMESKEK